MLSSATVTSLALALTLVGVTCIHPVDETPTIALGSPHFADETDSSGIDHSYGGGATFAVGGGVAAFDCDGDGKPDLYLAGGSNPGALYRNDSPIGGALQFTRLANPVTDLIDVNGAYPIDIDGDGLVDLVVLRNGEAVLLRGLGECRFERANEAWAFDGGSAWTTAFSATWEGAARLPTLAFGHYLRLDAAGSPLEQCADNSLVRPTPAGPGYASAAPLAPGYCALSLLFSDWDRSGRRDLRMSNDRQYYINGQEQLWRMDAVGPPRLYTAAEGWVTMQIWGMGIASYDVTGRGYPDVLLTSMGDNKLQTLTAGAAQPTYRDIALKRGVTAAQPFTAGDVLPSTAWHPEFQDVNNDGFVDLFISKGNVSTMPDFANRDPSNLLLGQADGTFKESADAAGILNFDRGRGAALVDFNLDGLLDLVEVNYGGPVRLWRNVGAGDAARPAPLGNWLAIRAVESGPNVDAIGAWIEVQVGRTTQRRELTIGGGHAGGQLGWTHFGIAAAAGARVRVQWPDGTVGPWLQVNANHFLIAERDSARARTWQPG
jgi:hypothetical protein